MIELAPLAPEWYAAVVVVAVVVRLLWTADRRPSSSSCSLLAFPWLSAQAYSALMSLAEAWGIAACRGPEVLGWELALALALALATVLAQVQALKLQYAACQAAEIRSDCWVLLRTLAGLLAVRHSATMCLDQLARPMPVRRPPSALQDPCSCLAPAPVSLGFDVRPVAPAVAVKREWHSGCLEG